MDDNIKFGTFRVDYIKFLVPLPVEHVKAWKDVFLAVMDADHIANGAPHTANVGSVKRAENGDYVYAFEAWGEVCANAVELPFEQWAPWLHRVDIRREADVTPEGLNESYRWLEAHCGAGRQVNQFNTPPRTKRGGRHSGGKGVQVGSHKSDFRVIIYRRTGEMGAIECNLSGDLLKDLKATAMLQHRSLLSEPAYTPWRRLISTCEVRTQVRARIATGLHLAELQDIAEGKSLRPITEEERLAEVDEHLSNLTLTGLASVYETLQLRLFPHEA